MKKLPLLLIFVLLGLISQAQLQNPNWFTKWDNVPGKFSYLKFSSTYPYSPSTVSLPDPASPGNGFYNSYCDPSGNLLFYINNGEIYDPSGYNQLGLEQTNGEIAIVPDITNCKIYHLVYVANSSHFKGIAYSILDISDPYYWTLSSPVYLDYGTDNDQPTVAASTLRTDLTRFIFTFHGTSVKRFLLNSSGLNTTPVLITPNTNGVPFAMPCSNSELEVIDYQGGYRIASTSCPAAGGIWEYIWNMRLDANGDYINNSWAYHEVREDIHGVEFDPTGHYLYYTHLPTVNYPDPVEYIDLTDQSNHVLVPAGYNYLTTAWLEMAMDGKLYFGAQNRFATFSTPSAPVTGVYTDNANLGSPNCFQLPDQIDGNNYFSSTGQGVDAGFTWNYSCNNNVLSLNVAATGTGIAQTWFLYVQVPTPVPYWKKIATSTGTNPTSWTFSDLDKFGIYRVGHEITNECGSTFGAELNVPFNLSGLDATFQLVHSTPVGGLYTIYSTTTLPTWASYYWKVEEIYVDGTVVPNTTLDNIPAWWSTPNSSTYCNFSGYCCNTNPNPAISGTFVQGHLYRFTHGVWSNCHKWTQSVMRFSVDKNGRVYSMVEPSADEDPKMVINNPETNFSVYPNPANNKINIVYEGLSDINFMITNMMGKTVIPETKYAGMNMQIDVSGWVPGLYILKTSEGTIIKFMVIE